MSRAKQEIIFWATIVSALGGVACILSWFGVRLEGGTTLPPHAIWLGFGVVLYLANIALVIYFRVIGLREAKRSKEAEGKLHEMQSRQSKLRIRSAFYGTPVNYESVADALSQQNTGAMAVVVSNNLASKDPVPNVPKHIKVKYSYGDDTVREITRMEDELLVLPEDPKISQAESQVQHWMGCYGTEHKQNEGRRHDIERLNSELSTLKAALKPKPVFHVSGVVDGGGHCQQAPTGMCRIQIANVRNIREAVPLTAINVKARIEYIHDDNIHAVRVETATWGGPGKVPSASVNLRSGEEEPLIVSMQRIMDGGVLASSERDEQIQELDQGHWTLFITVRSDNVPSRTFKGGLIVKQNFSEKRTELKYDNGGSFSVLEGEEL